MTAVAPHIMGIVNVTPDSFSGDGLLPHADYIAQAVAQAAQMIADGADMLDIGGESSRPGSIPVPAEEELRRTIPVLTAIKKQFPRLLLSIDTVKPEIAAAALTAGATIINDISAATQPPMLELAIKYQAHFIMMHNSAGQATHDAKIGGRFDGDAGKNIVDLVTRDLQSRAAAARKAGLAADKLILDPGIGFGKTVAQNLALIAHIATFKKIGFPILMGVSRKSFIGTILDLGIDEREEGTAACVAACALNGADILRVHNVRTMSRIAKMAAAIRHQQT